MHDHLRTTHRIRIPAPADTAFMFFTPAGEAHWVEGWQPVYLWPASGATREGMVFTTGAGDEFTIWLLADFDRAKRRSRYVRTTPGRRAGFVEIQVEPHGPADCQVSVSYEMTALVTALAGAKGDPLAAWRGADFAAMIDGWQTAIVCRLPELMRLAFE